VFHCHIFFHATLGMISEFDVVAANGNERPYVNAGAVAEEVNEGQVATMIGTSADPDGDAVTYSAVAGDGDGQRRRELDLELHDDGWADGEPVRLRDRHRRRRPQGPDIFASRSTTSLPSCSIASPPNGGIVQLNQPFTLTAPFTDPGTGDTHTCSIAWGDSTTSPGVVTEAAGSGTCTATHAYTTAGFKTITATVTDDDGGAGAAVVDGGRELAAGLQPGHAEPEHPLAGEPQVRERSPLGGDRSGRRHGDADRERRHAGRARERVG
jgi:hypothetical protein